MPWQEDYYLPEGFARWAPSIVSEIVVALAIIALAIGIRHAIDMFFKDVVVFAPIFSAGVATLLACARSSESAAVS